MTSPTFSFAGHRSSYILVGDDIVPRDVCDDIIARSLDNYDDFFYPGPTLGGVDVATKSSMDFDFGVQAITSKGFDPEPWATYESIMTEALTTIISEYQSQFFDLWRVPNLIDTGFRLQHYAKNYGYYREHIDGCIWGPVSSRTRIFGAVIYLNDIDSGGETHFPVQEQKVQAKAGRVALFPAAWTHPHAGMPAHSSDKWMISSFITCTPEEGYLEYDIDSGEMKSQTDKSGDDA
jgi:hypothetical protein